MFNDRGNNMSKYSSMSKDELKALQSELQKQFDECKAKNLKLNMARGLPSNEQLNWNK